MPLVLLGMEACATRILAASCSMLLSGTRLHPVVKGTRFMQNYSRTRLPNGIRLLTASLPHVRSVSIIYYFGVGSRYEQGEISGVSHFIEHMLFKGSQRY